MGTSTAAGGILNAKQAPHRPGTAPALGLRAGRAIVILSQTTFAKEMTMWFQSIVSLLERQPSATASRRSTSRLNVEILEDRSVPAVISDPVGDILPGYTGPHDPGLDVVAHEVDYVADQGRLVFHGEMAGPIAPTQSIGGLYIIGVDRGLGTARFAGRTPVIGPNVLWDSVVRVNPDGTGLFNNIIAGVTTPLGPGAITINGNEFTASVPLSLMLPSATRPPEQWTYNLWPRNSAVIGNNAAVPDLAPDDGNSPVQTIAPAKIDSVAVNDGSAQRSAVNSLTVTFDGAVTIDAGAFQLTRQDGSEIGLNMAASIVNGRTVAVLTFAETDLVDGSLAEGNYVLTIHGNHIHDRFGRDLDGDGDGNAGGDRTDAFFRLFGDLNGDGNVDGLDRDAFRNAFKSGADYLWYFDFDGDGDIDGRDNGQFNRRFSQGN
jgi:hypothetical protein